MIRRLLQGASAALLSEPLWRICFVWPRGIGDPLAFLLKAVAAAVWGICAVALAVLALGFQAPVDNKEVPDGPQ